ncbi:Patatin-like phospholipase [Formivibrio citricus]|uniref:Patatin-like phospholipase n=1 Tax=Formivibrio citricus TaxID=83765 RepID=A0A1I4VJM1_9NEIS|nr:patatin-like phospholipase family protein [Formivibrio citricus]SFN01333.1 Patatin-like phospholipase [Formivibrio citricus]
MARTALVISGGAPNSTLVAGALVAFHELGLRFDVVSTAGAGALLGLMYLAPKNGDPVKTLRELTDIGIADPLYEQFPVNYKVFNKPGVLADIYRRALAMNPLVEQIKRWPAHDPLSQWMKDGAELALACACPSDLNSSSKGLCAHVPFAGELIDFERIPEIKPAFYVNAYNLSRREMANWGKDKIDLLHLQAALSFPFIYPPTQIGDEFFIEGAVLDSLNFKDLLKNHPELEEIVVFDILGAEQLLRPPRDLYDAWVMSIITPLVEIARDDVKIFEDRYKKDICLHKVPLLDGISGQDLAEVFDWSRSNLAQMYEIGYKQAKEWATAHLAHLVEGGQNP